MPARSSKKEQLGEVERVYRMLLEWLARAKLAPGEFLSEPDLAARCNTSRTPVREACTRLLQDKWLTRIPRKGFLVTPISVRDIVELYEFRRTMECFAVEKVAGSASQEQIEELKTIVSPENNPNSGLPEILQANQRFHLRIAELAGNQRIVNQLGITLVYIRRLDTLCTQTVPGWIGHAEILRAIAEHRHREAGSAMAHHIDLSRDKMIKLFGA